jgi:aspartyl protease family protein
MKGFIIMAVGLVGFLLLIGQFLSPVRPLSGPTDNVTLAAPAPASAAPPPAMAGEALTIARDPSGQFHLDIALNGQPARFLVDTGADAVALTVADAERAGIKVDPATFQPILQTASGQGWGTLVTIDRLEFGHTELHNVGAVVVKDLGVSLLGQAVLGQLAKVELKGDTMVLEPKG